jgi:hypothetical protein
MELAAVFGVRFSLPAVSRMAATFTLTILAPLLAFTGCEKRVSVGNIETVNRQQEVAAKRAGRLEQVQEGLTMKEVESILGAPDKVAQGKIGVEVKKDFALTTWTYRQDGKKIELSFIDGKLQGKVQNFGEKIDAQAPLHMKPDAQPAEPKN